MKTKYSYLTAILLLSPGTPVQAQSEPGDFDGLQSFLNVVAEAAAERYESLKQKYDEYSHLVMMSGSDIRMEMNADFEAFEVWAIPLSDAIPLFWFKTSERTGSIYAEFDWQNMAESMRVNSSAVDRTLVIGPLSDSRTNEAEEFYMFIDRQGYWYVPSEDYGYLRVDPIGAMQNVAKTLEVGIEAAIDAKVTDMLDQLGAMMVLGINFTKFGNELSKFIPHEVMNELLEYEGAIDKELNNNYQTTFKFDDTKNVTENKLKPVLEDLAKFQFEQVSAIPAFIHFAFLISPTAIRSHFNVKEESVSFLGQVLSTRMTIASGKDAGYQIIFDRYGRLIHLRDTDGSTATYWYDKDVTVNIPPASSINVGNLMKLN